MNHNKELGASAADATDRATDAPHGADKSSPPSGSVSTGAGHTPGPWEATASGIWSTERHGLKVAETDGIRQAECYREPADGEREANASLIAAAPCLAEALREATEILTRLVPVIGDGTTLGGMAAAALISEAVTKYRAALAKARGES